MDLQPLDTAPVIVHTVHGTWPYGPFRTFAYKGACSNQDHHFIKIFLPKPKGDLYGALSVGTEEIHTKSA